MIPAKLFRELWRPSLPFLAGFLVFFLVAAVLVVKGGSSAAGVQPISFNHSKHVASGMGCTDCHTGAQNEMSATLPATSLCMACHETALTKSKEEERLRAIASSGIEIAWRPVTHVPAHVFFSHRRHVAIGGLGCETCHGGMKDLTAPPRAPLRALTMNACLNCHQQKKAGTECNDCHR